MRLVLPLAYLSVIISDFNNIYQLLSKIKIRIQLYSHSITVIMLVQVYELK